MDLIRIRDCSSSGNEPTGSFGSGAFASGRYFNRRIIVDKPDLKGRVDILKVHSKDVKMDETVDLEAIALATSGAVGSDLANMINEAAITAVKRTEDRWLVRKTCSRQWKLFL